jgi:hypothetical protein
MNKVFSITAILFFAGCYTASAQSSFKVANTFHIKSGGGWDYIVADPLSNHLYVSHGTQGKCVG